MTAAVVDGVCQLLAGDGVGAYSTTEALPAGARPITVGDMPADPAEAVTVTTYPGGPEPDSSNGWEYPRLQVRVRGADALAALRVDRAAYDVLQARSGPLPGGVWHLQDCYALGSEAQPLGIDSSGRHEYVRNYQLTTQLA